MYSQNNNPRAFIDPGLYTKDIVSTCLGILMTRDKLQRGTLIEFRQCTGEEEGRAINLELCLIPFSIKIMPNKQSLDQIEERLRNHGARLL